ncbi:MAG: 50S ribosomal protein L7/L12 [Mycoplasmataceae bacterium]|nr:50S ribosomal protein L7/L12 [Mycoplasmataceae bacterium]
MAKLTKETFIESLKEMNIKEVMQLVDAMKEEFGIDPTAVAAAAPAAAAEEKTEFTVMLKSDGGSKVPVIKAVKEALGLGLMDSKKLVESAPVAVKEGIKEDEAKTLADALIAAGAEVEIV